MDLIAWRVAKVAVANPSKMKTNKNAKNDRNDSLSLALQLANGTLPSVWVPDHETRQDRELIRHRMNIVQEQTRIKNRIRASLAEHRMMWPGSDIQSAGAQLFLVKLGTRLPEVTRAILADQLERLNFLEIRLKRIEQVIEVRADRWPQLSLLMSIRGIKCVDGVHHPGRTIRSTGSLAQTAWRTILASCHVNIPLAASPADCAITKAGSRCCAGH